MLTLIESLLNRMKPLKNGKKSSHAGTRTRVGEVKTRYPNLLDYMGPDSRFETHQLIHCHSETGSHRINECEQSILQRLQEKGTN